MSPMQLSLKRLRQSGWTVDVSEKIVPKTFIRKDLFGFADIVGFHPAVRGTLYVQCTDGDNFSRRIRKILENDNARKCLISGNEIVVHGWRKLKGKSGGKDYWDAKIRYIKLEEFGVL
jgi:hypothetical protein